MEFEWDDAKHRRNLRERGIGFDQAARIFQSGWIEYVDARFDYGEIRVRAVGEVADVILHVVYTIRGERYRIVSARRANMRERKQWQSRA